MNVLHVDEGTLHAYLDGELGPDEAQGIAAHLTQCPACRARLEEERALIARADGLLGLAAPPGRALLPFRPGDLKPPARLWWRVRWPLAWAATVLIALGVGRYLAAPRAAPIASLADRVERVAAPAAGASGPAASVPRARAPTHPPARPQPPAAHPALAPALAHRAADLSQPAERAPADVAARADSLAARGRRADAASERPEAAPAVPAPKAALVPAPAPGVAGVAGVAGFATLQGAPYMSERSPLDRDSARTLLGADPFVVPNLAVRGIYQARLIGYSAAVVVEQTLDSSRVVMVMTGRPIPTEVSAVSVKGVAQADSVGAGQEAYRRVARAARDSLARALREGQAAAARRTAPAPAGLEVDVQGPLSPDSLAELRRLVQPLPP